MPVAPDILRENGESRAPVHADHNAEEGRDDWHISMLLPPHSAVQLDRVAVPDRHVRVDLRRCHLGMAEQFLDVPQVVPAPNPRGLRLLRPCVDLGGRL